MVDLTFALIREGTSDDGLVPHIRSLLLLAGATSALGVSREYKGTTAQRIAEVLAEEVAVDLIFVHRDADDRDYTPRLVEVTNAATAAGCPGKVVPVVPVQELEAWLLTDSDAIRTVVGKPRGTSPLGLPAIQNIENTSSPKEVLQSACMAASGANGARRRKEARVFGQRRSTLLERLDLTGGVHQLALWQRFVDATTAGAVVAMTEITAAATARES